jgi:hypothetical protein
MLRTYTLCLLPISAALLMAGDQAWKDKPIAEWNDGDAKQVLADSPWVKTNTPTLGRSSNSSGGGGQRRSGGGMGRGGGINLGGVQIGLPGLGGIGGQRRGGGYPGGGGYPSGGGSPRGGDPRDSSGSADSSDPPALTLRWESALPVRSAELVVRDENAPVLDEGHYAIAVYGVPSRMAGSDSRNLVDALKKQASIKREGKKDLKPSSVKVLQKEAGPVIVYLFPRSTEITRGDKRIEFDAQVGRLEIAQSFYVDEMVYLGKLEL